VPVDRWPLVAAVLLGLLVTFSWTGRPRAVDALEVVQRAQSVDRSPVAGRITSFDVTTRITARSGAGAFVIGGWPSDVLFQALPQGANPGEPVQTELRQWFMAPDQLRAEAVSITPAGKTETVYISTGNDAWLYQAGPNVPILTRTGPAGTLEEQAAGVVRYVPLIAGPVLPSRPDGERCAVPKLTSDTERVAGRSVYHVTLDLDGAVCSAVPAPPGVGRMEWWIDREHFFILKTVDYSAADGQPLVSTEVTSVRFNIPIAPERFLFTLPRGVDVREEGLPAPPLFPGGGRDGPSLPANSRPPPSPSADTAPPDQ
jgi:outer membrane lipoprotein-sorting protein